MKKMIYILTLAFCLASPAASFALSGEGARCVQSE